MGMGAGDRSAPAQKQHVVKRQRRGGAAAMLPPCLAGVVLFAKSTERAASSKLGYLQVTAWKRSVPGFGGEVTDDDSRADITHAVEPQPGWPALPASLCPPVAARAPACSL